MRFFGTHFAHNGTSVIPFSGSASCPKGTFIMKNHPFRAHWISKQKADLLKRSGKLLLPRLLDHLKGFIIVEPPGSHLGDGTPLSNEAAEFELTSVWCLESKHQIARARQLLGMGQGEPADVAASI